MDEFDKENGNANSNVNKRQTRNKGKLKPENIYFFVVIS